MRRRRGKNKPLELEGLTLQVSPKTLSCKRNGRLGGLATARNHGEAFFQKRSSNGGSTTLAKYGPDFYRHMRQIGIENRRLRKLAEQKAAR